jgi:hypothetical protein
MLHKTRQLKEGEKWVYEPLFYLAKDDDFEKGARCAYCGKWIERKNRDSLQVHEMKHWD